MHDKCNATNKMQEHYKSIQCVLSEACALPALQIQTAVSCI